MKRENLEIISMTMLIIASVFAGCDKQQQLVPIPSEPEPTEQIRISGDGEKASAMSSHVIYGYVIDADTNDGIVGAKVSIDIDSMPTVFTSTMPKVSTGDAREEKIPPPSFHVEGGADPENRAGRNFRCADETMDGAFEIVTNSKGTYTLTISVDGYEPVTREIAVSAEQEECISASDFEADIIPMFPAEMSDAADDEADDGTG